MTFMSWLVGLSLGDSDTFPLLPVGCGDVWLLASDFFV